MIRRAFSFLDSARTRRGPVRLGAAALLGLVVLTGLYGLSGCETKPKVVAPKPGPILASLKGEPTVRVRIAQRAQSALVAGAAAIVVGPYPPLADGSAELTFVAPVRITRRLEGFIIQPARGTAKQWKLPALHVRPAAGGTLTVEGTTYPASLAIHPAHATANAYDVVNHVPIERYLPGVIARELYANWHTETFKAQAVAARSYAIIQFANNSHRHFDLENTEASQVYGGTTDNPTALAAVRATRGVVLTWDNRILPAYFSSVCGGTGQDAAVAFPHAEEIEPLSGRHHGGWCAAATTYRWGPIVRNRAALSQRIAAWGEGRKHPIAAIKALQSVTVSVTNRVGRPARFALTDTAGKTYDLGPEEFRFACNHTAPGVAELPKDQKLKSSHVRPIVVGEAVQFVDGRGHGHGVGLCQWGAQGIAMKGYNAPSILAFYYPGAQLTQAY